MTRFIVMIILSLGPNHHGVYPFSIKCPSWTCVLEYEAEARANPRTTSFMVFPRETKFIDGSRPAFYWPIYVWQAS
jgi:hypothetical protein